MKVLLLKDVYKLGHAGDVKKVADGYGRNYLIPYGFATLATPTAVKAAADIKKKADKLRAEMTTEMEGIAKKIEGTVLTFATKAGETGKLYGSITSQMIAEALSEIAGTMIDKKLITVEPIRTLGEHPVTVHLTADIYPSVKVIVHREGEKIVVESVDEKAEEAVEEAPVAEEEADESN